MNKKKRFEREYVKYCDEKKYEKKKKERKGRERKRLAKKKKLEQIDWKAPTREETVS